MQLLRRAYQVSALLLLTLCFVPAPAGAEPFKCSACHRGLDKGSVVHKPVGAGECLRCHKQFSDDHPLGKGSMGFIVPKEKLCVVCHSTLIKKPHLHKPVAQGLCYACHLPHSSDNKALLKAPAPALCFGCHPKEHFSASHTHPPVANGECLACHDPHQSDTTKLLRSPGSQLCFGCHDSQIAVGKSVHSPVAKGECVGCHSVHGSAYRKILKADLPLELYRPFSTDAFPLCFSCHNPELAAAVSTETATRFRNGDRNLHALHVNKAGKGRSCKICHNPHAAAQDRLINPKAPGFGTWEIPIRFEATPTGGSCSVGCHRTFRYDRVKAVVQ